MGGETDMGRPGRRGRVRTVARIAAYVVLAAVLVVGAVWGGDRISGAWAAHGALAELQRRGILTRLPSVEATAAERHPGLAVGDPDLNGTAYYEEALAFARNDTRYADNLLRNAGCLPELGRPFSPRAVAILKGLAASRQPFFDAVAAGRARPVCLYPFKPVDVLFADCDEVPGLRDAAHLLRADALLAQANGEADAAIDDCAAILDMTRTFDDCSLVLLWLGRSGAAATAAAAAEETLSRTTPSADALLRLRGKFLYEANAVNLRKVLDWQMAVSVNILRHPARQQARVDSFYESHLRMLAQTPGIMLSRRPWWKVWEPTGGWRESVGQLRRVSAEAVRLRLPWYDRVKQPVPALAAELLNVLQTRMRAGTGGTATPRSLQFLLRGQTAMRVAAVALSVEAYRAEQGDWPASLEELEGVDTTDPFTGADMGYIETDEGRVVYSVGTNGRDDGGRTGFSENRWSTDDLAFRLLDADRRNRN